MIHQKCTKSNTNKQNNRHSSPTPESVLFKFLSLRAYAPSSSSSWRQRMPSPQNQFMNRGFDTYLQCAGRTKPQELQVMIYVSNSFCNYTSTAGTELLRALDSSIFAATSATISLVRSSPAIKAAPMSIQKTAPQLSVEM